MLAPRFAFNQRVSVVMITRDRCDEAVATVLRLAALPERPRLVIVDNGSSDGTVTALRRISATKVIPLDRNFAAAGRNIGVEVCETPYVAFSDDDSWWEPGALDIAADLFERYADLALVAGRILVGPEKRLDPTCAEMAASALKEDARGSAIPIVGFLACGSVVRRRAFLDCGGFEVRFGVGGEEAVLAMDLMSLGWELQYVPEVVAYHWPSPVRDRRARRRREIRNALWSAWLRRRPVPAMKITALGLAEACHRIECRQGVVEALRGLPWALRNRRAVPSHVEERIAKAARSA
jgi:GT2 family glycosyltransferase